MKKKISLKPKKVQKYIVVLFALGLLSFNSFSDTAEASESNTPTLDTIKLSETNYLSKTLTPYTLSDDSSSGTTSVVINGTTYYFTPKDGDIDVVNLAKTASSALITTTDSSKAVFNIDGTYYTYDIDKLKDSAINITPTTSGNQTYSLAKDGVTNYYKASLKNVTNKAYSFSEGTSEDNSFVIPSVDGGKVQYIKVNLNDSKFGKSDKIVWNETDTPTGSVDVLGKTHKYTYNKPSDYTETSDRLTSITSDNTNKKVFKDITDTSYGGAIYNNTDNSSVNIVSDFINNSVTNSSSDARGGAIYNNGTSAKIGDITGDFIGNYASGSSNASGGAIYNNGTSAKIGDITGDFIGNYANSSSWYASGGAIYNSNGTIGDITGDFIGNYASGSSSAYGGAIYNNGTSAKIGDITGDFIGNYANSTSSEVYGGAIDNSGTIGNITGDFIGNYAKSGSGDDYGGATSNAGTIGDITGDFIGNYTSRSGGAIYSKGTSAKIGDITGDFIGNYAKSGSSNTYGGAITNYGIIGNITGDFIGNYANSSSSDANGGAIYNGSSYSSGAKIGSITGDFIGNYASGSIFASGGAIDNLNGTIGDITGDFIGNYANSSSSDANGGAIYNSGTSAKIGDITGDFIGNYANSSSRYAYGGAIYNGGTSAKIGNITGDFIGNYANNSSIFAYGGAIYNGYGTIGDITGDFIGNYASGKYAVGGAIYNSNGTIGDITGDFIGNYANSSSSYAYGGAIYNNGTSAKIGDITGDFIGNYASGKYAYGGAIYNYKGTITLDASAKNINFEGNYVKSTGGSAKGGAIYNDASGTINLNTADNNAINFKTSTDNIYNVGTMNFNSTDKTGVVNLQGVDGSGTVNVDGATVNSDSTFNQNTLNVNSGVFNIDKLSDLTVSTLNVSDDATLGVGIDWGDTFNSNRYTNLTFNGKLNINSVTFNSDSIKDTSYLFSDMTTAYSRINVADDVKIVNNGYYTKPLAILFDNSNGIISYSDTITSFNIAAKTADKDNVLAYSMSNDEISTVTGTSGILSVTGNNNTITLSKDFTVGEDNLSGSSLALTDTNIKGSSDSSALSVNSGNNLEVKANGGNIVIETNIKNNENANTKLIADNNYSITLKNSINNADIVNNGTVDITSSDKTGVVNLKAVDGSGTVNIDGATVNSDSTFTQKVLNIVSGVFNHSSGDISLNSLVNSGTANFNSSGSTSITTAENNGTINLNNTTATLGTVSGSGSTTIDNNANVTVNGNFVQNTLNVVKGVFNHNSNDTTITTLANNGTSNFNSSGSVTIGTVSGTGSISNKSNLSSSGDFKQDGLNNSGTFTNTNGNVELNSLVNSGTANFNSSGSVTLETVSGTGTVNVDGATVNANSGFSQDTLNVNSGVFNIAKLSDLTVSTLNVSDDATLGVGIDWGDTFNSNKYTNLTFNGKLKINEVDFVNSKISDDSYVFSNYSDKLGNISLSDEIKIISSPTTNNYVTYDNASGILKGSRINSLNIAISEADSTPSYYAMNSDEIATKNLDGILTATGNNNSITTVNMNVGSESNGGSKLTLIDTNINADTESSSSAITVNGGSELKIVADNHDIVIEIPENKNVLKLVKNDNGNSDVTIDSRNSKVTINGNIVSNDKSNKVNYEGSNNIVHKGLLDPLTANVDLVSGAELTRDGQDDDIQWNLNSGVLKYTSDSYLYNPSYNLNSVNFNGGSLDIANSATSDIILDNITVSKNSNIFVDVDLASEKMDTLNANSVDVVNGAKLNVSKMNLLSSTDKNDTSLIFTSNEKLAGNVETSIDEVTYSPVYKYKVNYEKENSNGVFKFSRLNQDNSNYQAYNPTMFVGSVATVGRYLTQVQSYDMSFMSLDNLMSLPSGDRIKLAAVDRYCMLDRKLYNDVVKKDKLSSKIRLSEVGQLMYPNDTDSFSLSANKIEKPIYQNPIWVRPYTSYGSIGLKHGPSVENFMYGVAFGAESKIVTLKNGWNTVSGAFASYDGSHQSFNGNSIYQNGFSVGINKTYFKNKFYTGLTLNGGYSVGSASTMYGNDTFGLYSVGVGSKTGYNFEFKDGRVILQPNIFLSYSFVDTTDYKDSNGQKIKTSPLNSIQVAPGVRLIGTTKNNWHPYIYANFVWNILSNSHVKAYNVVTPDVSVRPYVQYGVGSQKNVTDRMNVQAQVYVRNGGVNSIGLNAGITTLVNKEDFLHFFKKFKMK